MVRTTLECMMTAKPSRGEIYYRYFFWVKVEQNVKIGDPREIFRAEFFSRFALSSYFLAAALARFVQEVSRDTTSSIADE